MARIAGHHIPAAGMLFFAAEAAVVGLAARAGFAVGAKPEGPVVFLVVACAVFLQVGLYWADLYDVRIAADDARQGRRLLFALGATFAIAAPLTLIAPSEMRAAVPFALAGAGIGATALRALAPWEPLRRRLLIIGNGHALETVLAELRAGEDVVLSVERDPAVDLVARVRRLGAQAVVTAYDEDIFGVPPKMLLACRLAGIEVLDGVAYVQRARRKVPVDLI